MIENNTNNIGDTTKNVGQDSENESQENELPEPYTEVPLDDSDFKPKRRRLLTEPLIGIIDFTKELSRRSGYSQKSLRVVLEKMIEIFEDSIDYGLDVEITGFIKLYHQVLPPYNGVNAFKTRQTGKIVREDFDESQRSVIRLSKELRDRSKKRFKQMKKDKNNDIL